MSSQPGDAVEPTPERPAAWGTVAWFAAGLGALIVALCLIVVIRPLVLRLLAALALWIGGVAALIVFSDDLDRSWQGRRRRWAAEALHWLSASVFALALAVILGTVIPSLLAVAPSPTLIVALGCDLLIGLLAGLGTLLAVALSGWLGGELSYRIARVASGEERASGLRAPMRDEWSWRDGLRTVILALAGVLVSGLIAQLVTAGPSRTGAADTVPATPGVGAVVWTLVAWFAGTGLVWLCFDRVAPPDPSVHARRRRTTHASALAIGLSLIVGWGSAWLLNDLIQDSLSASRHAVISVSLQGVPGPQQVAYLAGAFVPQFDLAADERWEPTTVDWYMAHVKPPPCNAAGCRELTCAPQAGHSCGPCDGAEPGACAPPGGPPHAVYYRYLDATNTNDPRAPRGHDWAFLQYWIFYDYDSLQAGIITQWHQSDWEQVSVLVERRGLSATPVAVAFSEHCYGAVVPATEISWANGSHPISFVGLGSHANYPTPNDVPIRQLQCMTRVTPRYLGAAGLFFNPTVAGWAIELPIAYLIGLRDHTGETRPIADVHPIAMAATASIMSFGADWGIDNNLQIVAGRIVTGAGPQAPQLQNPSRHPFHDMLCAARWLKIAPTAATAWVCSR